MTPAMVRVRDSIVALSSGGASPSLRAIQAHSGVASMATVHKTVRRLEDTGCIVREGRRNQAIIVLDPDAHWSDKVIAAMSDAALMNLAERIGEEIWQRREFDEQGGE